MWTLRFDQTIGAGAFGTVYLGALRNESGLRRPVAIKMIVEGHADSEMFLTRMRDEARLLGMLKDRNVLAVLDLIRLEGKDAILMEYVNGADLEAVLERNGPLPAKAVAEVGAVIAGALDRAHRAVHPRSGEPLGVVHRDIKPANIMLTASGDLRLLDFGVARARFAARESTTGQLVLGTLNYMAPDYIISGEVHPALDVYGLALTLWELCTGEVFGQPKVRCDSHDRRLEEKLSMLVGAHGPLLPLLKQMLSWSPEDRPGAGAVALGMGELARAIDGPDLLSLARAAVPPILSDRPQTEDTEQLIGRHFRIGPPPGVSPEAVTERAQPLTEGLSDPSVQHTARGPLSDNETDISTPEILTRHLQASNSVTLNRTAESHGLSTPPRSSHGAILGGVLIGGLFGLLAVAGLAKLLFG